MSDQSNGIDMFALARLSPISSLLDEQIEELAAHTKEFALPPGRPLFKEGEEDNDLIYLIEGEVEIRKADGSVVNVTSGSRESRRPLVEKVPRRSTAVALTPVLYTRIDRDLVDTMLTWAESASSESEEVIMCGEDIVTIDTGALKNKMQHSPNFRKLPAANIDLLLEKMEPVRMCAGEVVIRQGDEGDYFYVIEQGEALVTRIVEEDEESEDSIEMAHLQEGSTFGEAALISDKPRNATVSMQTDGVLLRLNKENFLKLMQEPMQNWVTYDDAIKLADEGAVWIDVQSHEEFNSGHLPGAINIPMNDAHRRSQTLDTDKKYICYCKTGRRSSAAAFILSSYGLNVCVVKNGLPGDVDIELVAEAC
ncbi:cyclic nucleotide-binding domain-containing protein [Pseudomonadota bacterium]